MICVVEMQFIPGTMVILLQREGKEVSLSGVGGFTEMHHQSEEKVGAICGTRAENGVDSVYVCW